LELALIRIQSDAATNTPLVSRMMTMNKHAKTLLACAAIAGIYSGVAAARAFAADGTAGQSTGSAQVSPDKNSCSGKAGCNGKAASTTPDDKSTKASCKGQQSCKAKDSCKSQQSCKSKDTPPKN